MSGRARHALALACVLALAMFLACSGKKLPSGGLQLVLATNLRAPQEYDQIRLEIRQDGSTEPALDRTFRVPEDATLPTTWAIAAGTSKNQLALIRASARKGTAEVVVRAVQVNVPVDRVKRLDLLLSSACAGKPACASASESCQPATGACGSSLVDAASLPDYVPGDENGVDGGGVPTPGDAGAPDTGALDTGVPLPVTSTTTLASSLNPAEYGAEVTLTATVTPGAGAAATGTVTFKDGATVLGTGTLSAGKTTLATSKLKAGKRTLRAEYGGDARVLASTSAPLTQAIAGPSCKGLPKTCGPTGNADCCASTLVPGGTFLRSYDGVTHNDASGEATVSDFKLDDYEITVGRFRAYVDAYPGNKPEAGEGKNPNNATDPGWDAAWNSNVGKMPATQAALVTSINCQSPTQRSWTDAPGANENRAMDCLTWYDVFAFCIWDGGRTPTEAEWNYAAAGGDQQRFYAFSNPATSTAIDATKAVFDMPSGTAADVGSKPLGNGRWGHADLNGNVYEWVLDRYHDPYAKPCKDCADTTSMDAPVMRGGSFIDPPSSLNNSFRNGILETAKVIYIGGRCARSP